MCDKTDRTQQEYEFIMEGITTRMQMAMDKLAECNKQARSTIKYVCNVMLTAIIVIVIGFIVFTHIWIGHVDNIRANLGVSGVTAGEEVSQLGPGTDD